MLLTFALVQYPRDLLISLAFSHYKCGLKIFISYLPGFCLNPAFNAYLLNAAEIEEFYIMRIGSGFVGRRREERTREIITVTAHFHTLCLDAIQGCAPVRDMKMFSILLAATLAGYFIFRHTEFGMDRLGDFVSQIVLVNIAKKTGQTTRRRQSLFVFHGSSL